ncbi:MAG TPA: glycosyltransferase [Roseiarcus sp.]|nr:glycosyltransferase [Roseiarcus sp.]
MSSSSELRIVHVFRAPLGGLFRHVIDLAGQQAARGHAVGLFFDSGADCERVREAIARIPGGLSLGMATMPIRRNPHPADIGAFRAFTRYLAQVRPDVVHGHGSKGGLLARASGGSDGARRPIRVYTPHGGSFNYKPGSAVHRLYMAVERALSRRTDLFLFESDHIRRRCEAYVALGDSLVRVVVNGLGAEEFIAARPAEDAADVLYVGELRAAKGVDTLIDALAALARQTGVTPSATLVGSGPDREALMARAERLGLGRHVQFPGPMPVRRAFCLGRIMVAPSRAESMPYIVLESVAAKMALLTTDVGGIPEIFGPYRDRLGPPDDAADLARRIGEELRRPAAERNARAAEIAAYVQGRFSMENMVETVLSAYREALARRDLARAARRGAGADLVNEA